MTDHIYFEPTNEEPTFARYYSSIEESEKPILSKPHRQNELPKEKKSSNCSCILICILILLIALTIPILSCPGLIGSYLFKDDNFFTTVCFPQKNKLEEENNKMEEEYKHLKKNLSQAKEEMNNMTSRCSDLEKKNESLNKSLSQAREEMEKKTTRCNNLEKEKRYLNEEMEKMEEQISSLHELEKENERLKDEKAEFFITQLNLHLLANEKKKQDFDEEIVNLKRDIHQLKSEKEDLNVEVENWKNKTSLLEEENEMLKNNHQEILWKNQEEIRQLKEHLLAVEKKKEDLNEEKVSLNKYVGQLEKEKEDLNVEIEKLNNKTSESEEETQNLRQSSLLRVKEDSPYRCPNGWKLFPKAASCYLIILEAMNNTKAEVKCEQYGGQLASIHNEEENQFVANAIPIKNGSLPFAWIGMKRNETNLDQWINVDRTQAIYTNWGAGEPDNLLKNENCVHIIYNMRWKGKWSDMPCNGEYVAICKKKAADRR